MPFFEREINQSIQLAFMFLDRERAITKGAVRSGYASTGWTERNKDGADQAAGRFSVPDRKD